MAGPHVVGVVALLWQAVPSLNRDIAATKARLSGTANPNMTPSNGRGAAASARRSRTTTSGMASWTRSRPFRAAGLRLRLHHRHLRLRHLRHLRHLRRRHHRAHGRTSLRCRRACSAAQRPADGTYAYVFGGYNFPEDPGSTLDTVYRYNVATDTWTQLANMPNAALVASAVYYPPTNKIYVFGGSTRTPDPPSSTT